MKQRTPRGVHLTHPTDSESYFVRICAVVETVRLLEVKLTGLIERVTKANETKPLRYAETRQYECMHVSRPSFGHFVSVYF